MNAIEFCDIYMKFESDEDVRQMRPNRGDTVFLKN